MKSFFLVMLGGGLGAALRYSTSLIINISEGFPWSTFTSNLISSLILGVCLALYKNSIIESSVFLFLGVGLCGGFSTFSSFSLESLQLLQQGKEILALSYIALSTLCALLAVYLGLILTQNLCV